MELKRISIESIQPDPNNPRSDFGDLKAFAETFKLNRERPGEPYIPPIVVADGPVFRMVDGERRWLAMKEAGTKECAAYVCSDFDEADVLMAMMATDNKLALTEVERSVGVQRMLLLGVDARKVETAAGLRRGQGRKVKKAIEAIGEGAAQATIEQILKAQELNEMGAGDEDVASVLEAAPGDWEGAYKEIRKRLASEQALRDFTGYLASEGLHLVGAPGEGMAYERIFRRPDELLDHLESHPDREGMEFVYDQDGQVVDLYVPRAAQEPDGAGDEPGEAPSKAVDMAWEALKAGGNSRLEWYLLSCKHGAKRQKRLRATPHVDKMLEAMAARASSLVSDLAAFGLRDDELAQGGGLTGLAGALIASLKLSGAAVPAYGAVKRLVLGKPIDDGARDVLGEWVGHVEPFMFDGWRMGEGEAAFYELACGACGRRPYDDGGAISPSAAQEVPIRIEEEGAPESPGKAPGEEAERPVGDGAIRAEDLVIA